MAEEVGRAMESRARLLVEAGTGVGKSFAYLVPAMLRCALRGEKVVIATATIALQEQLINKDIPLLLETMEPWLKGSDEETERRSDGGKGTGRGSSAPPSTPQLPSPPPSSLRRSVPPSLPIRAILAKGRGNYLSIRRLKMASQRQHSILPDAESIAALHAIEDWAYATKDGTLSSLPVLQRPEVWDHVRSDTDNCMGRKCPHHKECFYQQARRALEEANLVVCNHALFFSDLALRVRVNAAGSGGGGGSVGGAVKAILPNYDHVIFDEAHGLEDAAAEHFGLSLSRSRVVRLLRTLYSSKRRKGYLLERSLALADTQSVDRAISLVAQAEHEADAFFDDLNDLWTRSRATSGRIRTADAVDNTLTPALRELSSRLRLLREQVPGESTASESERLELASFARRASELADCAEAMIGQTLRDCVYWVDVEGGGGVGGGGRGDSDGDDRSSGRHAPHHRFRRVTLACAPVDVADVLRRALFAPGAAIRPAHIDDGTEDDQPESASAHAADSSSPQPPAAPPKKIGIVLTSATLATRTVREDEHPEKAETAFAYIMNNLGIPEARTLQLGSPFDYRKQARVVIDISVPNPRSDSGPTRAEPYDDLLAARVLHHVKSTDGGAFVLFTSFATLNAVADRIGPALTRLGMPLLAQGRDGPRQMILKAFMESECGVLLGAASFWQGVDVRGERLRNVIITRLPFEPPDRPLTQARMERIELAGGNPFMQDSLPRAIIRFKQGFGRLIRSRSDRGQVVVLDPRITTARYGRLFLSALPSGVPVQIIGRDGDEVEVDEAAPVD